MKTLTTMLAVGTFLHGVEASAEADCPSALDFENRRFAGNEVDYFSSMTSPQSAKLVSAIEKLL